METWKEFNNIYGEFHGKPYCSGQTGSDSSYQYINPRFSEMLSPDRQPVIDSNSAARKYSGVIWSQYSPPSRGLKLNEMTKYITARVKKPNQINITDGQHNDVRIPKEEAVCRFCFKKFEEDQKVLETKCKCNFTLAHEECATEWSRKKGDNKCDFCDQETQHIPLTLIEDAVSSASIASKKKHEKGSAFQRFWRRGAICFSKRS